MKKLIIVFLLVVTMSSCPVYNCYADAGSITIAGGSIGVAGIGAAGLAGLTGPVVVAVFCAALAFGMDIELTEASEAAGMTKTEFLKNKIQEYCNEANITMGVFNKAILDGMTVLQDGSITLTNQAAKQIKQLLNWLFNTDQVIDPDNIGQSDTVDLGDLNLPYTNNAKIVDANGNMLRQIDASKNYALYAYRIDGGTYITAISNEPFTYKYLPNTNTFNANKYKEYYYTLYGTNSVSLSNFGNIIPDVVINNLTTTRFIDSLDGSFDISAGQVQNDTFTGKKDDWVSGSSVLDPTAGQTIVINPGLSIPVPADKDVTVNVQDYLDAIQKVLDKLNDISIPAVDDTDGIPTEIDIPDETVIDPTVEKEEDTDIPDPDDTTPVINDEDTPIGPAAVEPLKFDLRNIFPFCIPFDIKDMLSKLSATPQAPYYHVEWDVPWIDQNLEFTVDLSSFNDVAAICRKMELLAFIVGLAFVTRSMFIRS